MIINENYLNDWNEIKKECFKHDDLKLLFTGFDEISYEDAKNLDKKEFRHAAHLFIWSRTDNKLWTTSLNAFILMQHRFDGFLGFPGGFIDEEDNNWEEGLNRELKEEINLNSKFNISEKNYFFTTINIKAKIVLHFYLLEVKNDEFVEIERDAMNSKDWGGEVLGILRPPLFEMNCKGGLYIFLKSQFKGNSLVQFLKAIIYLNILPVDKVIRAIHLSRQTTF